MLVFLRFLLLGYIPGNAYLAPFPVISSSLASYCTFFQYVAHTAIAFNRFTAFYRPLLYQKVVQTGVRSLFHRLKDKPSDVEPGVLQEDLMCALPASAAWSRSQMARPIHCHDGGRMGRRTLLYC